MMWGYWGNNGPGLLGWLGMCIGMLVNLAIIGLIIYLVVRAFSGEGFRGIHRSNSDNAIGILKERYAKGEIDEEEYRKRLDLLSK